MLEWKHFICTNKCIIFHKGTENNTLGGCPIERLLFTDHFSRLQGKTVFSTLQTIYQPNCFCGFLASQVYIFIFYDNDIICLRYVRADTNCSFLSIDVKHRVHPLFVVLFNTTDICNVCTHPLEHVVCIRIRPGLEQLKGGC